MLALKIGRKKYEICSTWYDVNLLRCVRLDTYVRSLPEWLHRFLKEGDDSEVENPFLVIDAYLSFLEILSNIPATQLKTCALSDIKNLYEQYTQHFVVSMFGSVSYLRTGIKSFKVGGMEYCLPVSDVDLSGNVMPGCDVTALEICEVSDLHLSGYTQPTGPYTYAANIASILCRPEGEPYFGNERICKQRAERFATLPMPVVFEVYSILVGIHKYASNLYPNLYKTASGTGGKSKTMDFGWGGKIMWLAGGVENDSFVERMNAYEFLRRISYKIAENEL